MSQKAPAKNSSGAAVARQGHVRAKRAQVQVACEACRKRKVRVRRPVTIAQRYLLIRDCQCDALRPCGSCADRQTPCHYETEVGETYAQASKRKYEEVSQAYDTYKELFDFIRTRNERDVSGIIRRIRSGQDPEAIVKSVATRDAAFALPDPHMIALEMFLVNLAHSTGSLQDIVRLAMESTALIQLPGPQDFRILCNRIVHFPCMESVLRKSLGNVDSILPDSESGIAAGPQLAIDQSETENDDYSTDDDIWSDGYPPYQVPAEPWTTLTTSDKAVSHLVSVFLTWHNPTWSFVETDLFLKGKYVQARIFFHSLLVALTGHDNNHLSFRHAIKAAPLRFLLSLSGQQYLCHRKRKQYFGYYLERCLLIKN